MPIYEYSCNNCDHRFELLIRKRQKIACPECNSANLTKLFSVFSAKRSSKETSPCSSRTPYCPEGPCPEGTCPMGEEE